MTDQERRLAEALRDLCGWHEGMVYGNGKSVVTPHALAMWREGRGGLFSGRGSYWLPKLDSPANWGHWLSWCWGQNLPTEVAPQMPKESGRFAVSVDFGVYYCGESFAAAFLKAVLMRLTLEERADLPPSVLAWWKHEQGEGSDG